MDYLKIGLIGKIEGVKVLRGTFEELRMAFRRSLFFTIYRLSINNIFLRILGNY